MNFKALALLPALALSAPLMAQEDDSTGLYVSGEVGRFRLESPSIDSTGNLRSVVVGYRLNPHLSVEGGLTYVSDLGGRNPGDISAKADIISARAFGRLPLTEMAPGLSLIAGVGLHSFDLEMTYLGATNGDSSTRRSYLLGGELDEEQLVLRLMYEKFNVPNATESNAATFSFGWKF